jgi:hypothetical protein
MSASPQQMQALLALYKQQFPNGQTPAPSGYDAIPTLPTSAPAGANKTAGGVNGAAQLVIALMKAKKLNDTQQQLNAAQNQGQVQGPPAGSIAAMYPTADQQPPVPVGTVNNPGGAF